MNMKTSCRFLGETASPCITLLFRRLTFFAAIITLLSIPAKAATYPYLDDANKNAGPPANPQGPQIGSHNYPRVYLLGIKTPLPANRYAKYHQISGQGWEMSRVGGIQQSYPDVMYLRQISPRAYQGYGAPFCTIGQNMAFEGTGPVTQGGPQSAGCNIYAGHWLYEAGSPLTQSINTTTKTLKVADAKRFDVGQYVVIYNAPAGSFNNAEHAKISAKNNTTNTLTLSSRGYKSNPKSHPAGAIVAQHVRGQGTDARLWAYNLSSKSPKDGAGKTMPQAMSDWLRVNIGKSPQGGNSSADVAGMVFDADFYFEIKNSDADNNLVRDDGMSASGTNWWGEGLEHFYSMVRNKLPNMFILGGTPNSRGFPTLNGTQMESWPVKGGSNFSPNPKYDDVDHLFGNYRFHANQHDEGPAVVHNLSKNPTKTYPETGSGVPATNKVFRFGLGLTLLDNGYYGRKTTDKVFDPWYDEFAVDVTSSGSDYGQAVHTTDIAGARQHRGWLGKPTGRYSRIYNDAAFAANQSMLSNGTFDSNINGWSGNSVNVSRVTTNTQDGAGALRASNHSSYKSSVGGATIKGPKVPVNKNTWYTIAFSARASSDRQMKASVGSSGQTFLIGTDWRRYVLAFKAKSTGNHGVVFSVGRENTQVWIDSVYVFEGNANVFRRDFDNGIVVVNATENTRTINLGGTFQRIKGNQSGVNDGSSLSQLTLPAYDAAVLLRPQGGGGGGTVNVNVSSATVTESNGSANLSFTLSKSSNKTVRVDYSTANGSALAGQDYSANSGTITFNPGQTSKSRNFNIINDTQTENTESFVVNLTNPQNANINNGTGTVTINDDDSGGGGANVQVSVSNTTVTENAGTAKLIFTLSNASNKEVKIDFSTTNGSATAGQDYGSKSGTVTFDPGQKSKTRKFTIINDNNSEGTESFTVNLSNPRNVNVDNGTGTITVNDDDSGGGSINVCGRPDNYNPAIVRGLFVWKSCSNNNWHIRTTAAGPTVRRYVLNVVADVAMTNVGKYSMESGTDSIIKSQDGKRLDIISEVINKGDDGAKFKIPGSTTSACLRLNQSHPIYIGKNSTVVTSPVNLLDPTTACQ